MAEHGLTRREALGVGTAGLAAGALLLRPGTAGAAGAAPAAVSRPTVSLEEAKAVLAAAEAKATEIGVPMYLIIVDDAGQPKASLRMDGNSGAALTLVPPKAFTAVSFKTPTNVLAERVASDPVRVASFLANGEFTLLGGGVPLAVGGEVVGAIGVGGGTPEQDTEVGLAGAAVLAG
jgi:uncharacterized protein GlcG (DUF336 family)